MARKGAFPHVRLADAQAGWHTHTLTHRVTFLCAPPERKKERERPHKPSSGHPSLTTWSAPACPITKASQPSTVIGSWGNWRRHDSGHIIKKEVTESQQHISGPGLGQRQILCMYFLQHLFIYPESRHPRRILFIPDFSDLLLLHLIDNRHASVWFILR